MRVSIVIFSLALLISLPVAAQNYLCISEQTTGFKYNPTSKRWEQVSFAVNDKYHVKQIGGSPLRYEVQQFGKKDASYWCEYGFGETGVMFCDGPGQFRISNKTLRYMLTYMGGYVRGDNFTDTPYVELGACTTM